MLSEGCYGGDLLEPHYTPSQRGEVPRVPREICPPLLKRGLFHSGKSVSSPSQGRCRGAAASHPSSAGVPLLHNPKTKGLGQAWTPVCPTLLLPFKMILTGTVWCSLSEWKANQARQCQGLKKVCPCQGPALMGVRHQPCLPHTPPALALCLVKAQRTPSQYPAAGFF